MRKQGLMMLIGLATVAWGGLSRADVLSIYDVQSTTSDGDASIYNGQVHDVTGGIVTHKWSGFQDRVYLRDPAHPTWGAIMVKDSTVDRSLFNNVGLGDWVSLTDIYIEEFRGTTVLQYSPTLAPNVGYAVQSTGNPVPDPTLLTAADLIVPVDHAASEPYESMIVKLENVTAGQKDLGKAGDNYELIQGADIAWGTDYMNIDAGAPYDPRIVTGAQLESITGVVEQYTKLTDGWDYYQLCTRSAGDIVPEPATLTLVAAGLCLAARRRRKLSVEP
ncbi:MAG: PEP-CTERM sorting domain-containing protein [Phycisphaerales bacterium]|nr:MAG: PEP-CTERM sorting domain-containing protein [Phycisphaerales bacterium]